MSNGRYTWMPRADLPCDAIAVQQTPTDLVDHCRATMYKNRTVPRRRRVISATAATSGTYQKWNTSRSVGERR